MSKFLIMVMIGLVGFQQAVAQPKARIFKMKNYSAKLAGNGTLVVSSNDYQVMTLPMMTFSEKVKTSKRVWPPRINFFPDIKVTEADGKTEINISYSEPGMVKSFEKKVIFTADTISVTAQAIPAKKFYACTSGIELNPEVFDGAEYNGVNNDKPVADKMPEGVPEKHQFTFNGLGRLAKIVFSKTKIGTVLFDFTRKSPRGLSDYRALKWSRKYNFHYFKINYPADKLFSYTATIKISDTDNSAGNFISVPLDSSLIYIKGAKYVKRSPSEIIPYRFSDAVLTMNRSKLNFNPVYAKWTSGIKMFFATAAKNITVKMNLMPFKGKVSVAFRVYRDGALLKDFYFARTAEVNPIAIKLASADNKLHRYRIDFPTTATLAVTGLKIAKDARLQKINFPNRPIYIALGDSVTHGSVGLDGLAAETYPAILADRLGYELYNLGIAGSKVSVPAGEMLKDWKRIDLITLLIGFNDYSWGGVSIKDYRAGYIKLIEAIRKNYPQVPLFCLTLTYTRLKKSKKTGVTADEYRQTVYDIVQMVQQRGDNNIFLLYGDELTDATCLHDSVHLNANGNKIFADKLYTKIRKKLKK
ncbi:MAG: SGNH/GDSL hydrolase family protein [Victivallaceae bacterium]|nr:SGNH/GDSL hydrolase family protein [Victivallaceae bacterium]